MQLHMPIICACFAFFNYLSTVTGYCITQFVKSWRQAEWIIFFLSNVNTACMFPSKDKDAARQHLLYVWLRWSEGCDWWRWRCWGQRVKEGGWHHRGLSHVLSLSAAVDVAARMKEGGRGGWAASWASPSLFHACMWASVPESSRRRIRLSDEDLISQQWPESFRKRWAAQTEGTQCLERGGVLYLSYTLYGDVCGVRCSGYYYVLQVFMENLLTQTNNVPPFIRSFKQMLKYFIVLYMLFCNMMNTIIYWETDLRINLHHQIL